jgi:hypothetical protein
MSETVGDWERADNVYVYMEKMVGRHRDRRRRRLGVFGCFCFLTGDTLTGPKCDLSRHFRPHEA